MPYQLTLDEKTGIVNSQIRNVLFRKYTAEVELIAENAVTVPNTARISDINAEIAKCDSQLSALTTELESLE